MEKDIEWISEDDDAIEDEDEVASEPFTEEELAEARRYSLLIQWSPEDLVYMALSPEFPRLMTHGETQEVALAMGVESVAFWMYLARHDGEPVPEPNYFSLEPKRISKEYIRGIRNRLGVSQDRFARALNVSVSSVRAWEQGLRQPEGPTLRLLELADRYPEILMDTARAS